MRVSIHPHAAERLRDRGISAHEAAATVETGEIFPVKFAGRIGFRRNFAASGRQVEAQAIRLGDDWILVTATVRAVGDSLKAKG